jgi:hypothetical protein
MVGLIAIYVLWKFVARQRVLRSVRMARITPQELHALMQAGTGPAIVDARNRGAMERAAAAAPGRAAAPFRRSRRGTTRCRATGTSSSTIPDPTSCRAPVWRSS